jgi:hypothetical protein
MIGLKRAFFGLFCALVCMAVAGCGGGGEKLVTVTGKVLQDGQPVKIENYVEGEECLSVNFFPLDEGGNRKADASSFSQDVQEDGSFEMRGNMGKGIPAGKYRVGVSRETEEGVEDEEDLRRRGDDIWSKFGPENSPFVFDVPSGEIVIDISKPGG